MKAIFRKLFLGALIALMGMSVVSCNDDDAVDPYDINYAYIYAPGYTNHAISYLEDGTIVKAINEEEKIIPVRCTRPAPNDLKITFSIDESLIDAYNKEHGIIPKTIQKSIRDLITNEVTEDKPVVDAEKDIESMTKKELKAMIDKLTKKMNMAAADLNFEMAAIVRDELKKYKEALRDYDK